MTTSTLISVVLPNKRVHRASGECIKTLFSNSHYASGTYLGLKKAEERIKAG